MNFKPNLPPSGKRFAVPNIMQMELTECGAASLGMIFAYYKNWMPLEDLRLECGVTQHGSNAALLLSVARKYGFIAKGVRVDIPSLKDLYFPMILFWNQNHFVVLEGIKKGKYYINDPASGSEVLSEDVFRESFSHICLLIQPGPHFHPNNQLPPSELKNLMFYISQNRSDFLFICFITTLLAIPGLLLPFFIKRFVDGISDSYESGHSTTLFFTMICLVCFFSLALSWFQHRVIARFEMKLSIDISKNLVRHILRLPLEYFAQRFPGDICQRLRSVEILASLISGPASHVMSLSLMAIYGITMFFYSSVMTCGIFIMTFCLLFLFFKIFKKRADNSQKLQNEIGQAQGVAASDLRAIETLQANGNIHSFFERCSGFQARTINSFQKENIYTLLTGILPMASTTITAVFVLGYGGWMLGQNIISLGDLLAFQTLSLGFMAPLSNFMALGGQLSTSKAHFNRINDVMNYREDTFCQSLKKKRLSHLPTKKLSGNIELCDITFGYDRNSEPLFKNFSLSIKPQERIAILGKSGSGKSTLAQLICGLRQPWSGKILFDGEELHEIPNEIIVDSFSYVNQDIFLFEGTVRENLSLWNTLISEAEMISALQDACIHNEVYARPEQLNSGVVGSGTNFSGGERQRLEIARALSNRPSILILDEATSALDPIVEAKIEDHLRRRACTCIVIAHRLSTIRDANQLILLDQGKIIERGRHEELKNKNGPYHKLLLSSSELV